MHRNIMVDEAQALRLWQQGEGFIPCRRQFLIRIEKLIHGEHIGKPLLALALLPFALALLLPAILHSLKHVAARRGHIGRLRVYLSLARPLLHLLKDLTRGASIAVLVDQLCILLRSDAGDSRPVPVFSDLLRIIATDGKPQVVGEQNLV